MGVSPWFRDTHPTKEYPVGSIPGLRWAKEYILGSQDQLDHKSARADL